MRTEEKTLPPYLGSLGELAPDEVWKSYLITWYGRAGPAPHLSSVEELAQVAWAQERQPHSLPGHYGRAGSDVTGKGELEG